MFPYRSAPFLNLLRCFAVQYLLELVGAKPKIQLVRHEPQLAPFIITRGVGKIDI